MTRKLKLADDDEKCQPLRPENESSDSKQTSQEIIYSPDKKQVKNISLFFCFKLI